MPIGFPALPAPPIFPDALPNWHRLIFAVVNTILTGKLNCTGTVTLTANATTTTLTDARLTSESVILPMATTANAAAALSLFRVTSRTKGSAVITHGNDGATDKTFAYAIIG